MQGAGVSSAGLQHRCPSCGTAFSPRLLVEQSEGQEGCDAASRTLVSKQEFEIVSSRSLRLLLERVLRTEGEQALCVGAMAQMHPRLLWNLVLRLTFLAPGASVAPNSRLGHLAFNGTTGHARGSWTAGCRATIQAWKQCRSS